MSCLPPGADKVLRAGPADSTTYGTGSSAATATSSTAANRATRSSTVRGCRPAGGGAGSGAVSNGSATSRDTRPSSPSVLGGLGRHLVAQPAYAGGAAGSPGGEAAGSRERLRSPTVGRRG